MGDRYGEANKDLWLLFCECAKSGRLSLDMRQINLCPQQLISDCTGI
jgi:hypothetical protein